MKIPKQGKKNMSKKKNNPKKKFVPDHFDEEIPSDDLVSNQDDAPHHEQPIEDYKTPEQIKIQMAKKLIKKTKSAFNKKQGQKTGGDDFFMVDEEDNQANAILPKRVDLDGRMKDEEEYVSEALKNQYLRSKNKLYVDYQQRYAEYSIAEPIAYKGHTRCITAIEVLPDFMFSCSKDRSIIRWDRETGKKDFITLGDNKVHEDHSAPILCMSYHQIHQMLATSGDDGLIKLWDTRSNKLIQTLKGHRNTVNGLVFGKNSNNLASVSVDKTFKQWDCSQRGLIQTFYGHNAEVLDIDYINENDFVSSGNDHQAITWKTQKQTQVIYEGHDYAIDRVRSINQEKFLTASQDGGIFLWSSRKKKPIFKMRNAHDSWIGALDTIKQSNIFASGGCDSLLKIWAIGENLKGFQQIHQIQTKGIVTDVKINEKQVIATSCDEHRLGRWITKRCRNQIQVFKFKRDH